MTQSFDLVFKNVRIVRPAGEGTPECDIGVRDGRFVEISDTLDESLADRVVDAKGQLGFPGLVDAHMHVGIYGALEQDAGPESSAAAAGGVTTALTYFRTGQYYLDRGGPYASFYPEVLERSKGRYFVDYAYHLAPITGRHIGEMESLCRDHGVTSFKIFMFYGSHGLHGRSDLQRDFLMLDEGDRYDIAHFEFIMRELQAINARAPELGAQLSLSLHCELADILTAYTERVQREGLLDGLAAYSAARPPHSEGLAIFIAAYLANETAWPRINLLHLSSSKAIEAALQMSVLFPHIDFRREVTVGHLLLDVDAPTGAYAKVNPPIRPRADVERLWEAVLAGDVDWIVSDHACCSEQEKVDPDDPQDIWRAKSGFGGTEWLLSGVFSEGTRRGLTPNRIAALLSRNPAARYGLHRKGDIAPGYDADLVLFDPAARFTVRAADSPSGQGYTPFEGLELVGRVNETWLRGERVYDRGKIVGLPRGLYLPRPYGDAVGSLQASLTPRSTRPPRSPASSSPGGG